MSYIDTLRAKRSMGHCLITAKRVHKSFEMNHGDDKHCIKRPRSRSSVERNSGTRSMIGHGNLTEQMDMSSVKCQSRGKGISTIRYCETTGYISVVGLQSNPQRLISRTFHRNWKVEGQSFMPRIEKSGFRWYSIRLPESLDNPISHN